MSRTVVITGGTKGMGRELSLAFAREGHAVVALYANDDAAASRLRAEFDAMNARGCVAKHDAASDDPALWARQEIAEAKSLTLIHNACAPFSPGPLHQLHWQDFQSHIDVAVKGAWFCTQALIRPMLKKGGGAIINILTSVIEEENPPKGFAAYVTAKHALRGFTQALAAEYAPRGVRVFSVSPGFMDTPLTQGWDERLREAIRGASHRITQPAGAAARIVELAGNGNLPGHGEDYPV